MRPYYALVILTVVYAFSYLDRQLPNLLLQSIKEDLRLTDTQVSLLTGTSFALCYSLTAIPLSNLADQWSRKGIIAGGIIVWGLSTAFCGIARTFAQLFSARMGVGLGEAALTPAAYSLISDLFPPPRRARAMAIFTLGAAVGTGLALVLGAEVLTIVDHARSALPTLIRETSSWKIVLAVTGLMTLALLPFALSISDPDAKAEGGLEDVPFPAVAAIIWRDRRAYSPILIGIPLVNMAASGFSAWAPTFFIRVHSWSASRTGLALGMAGIMGGLLGTTLGGWLSDVLSKRSPDAPLLLSVAALLSCSVIVGILSLVQSADVQLVLAFLQYVFVFPVGVLGAVSLQEIAPARARARISAIYVMAAGLVGVGLGPTLIGLMNDFLFHNAAAVGKSMALSWLVTLCICAPVIMLNRRAFTRLALAERRGRDGSGLNLPRRSGAVK